VPLYKEVNPAVFATVTFPFLFGVMFGDIFHGLILLVFGALLCFRTFEENSILRSFQMIRYLLVLMGLFSTYCGYIYNDFSSIPLETFGQSCYGIESPKNAVEYGQHKVDCVYPLGVDPVWYLAKNELAYFNSLKMKIAVILGVL
jgi:V-type H+-transporting ATPase subunit a